MHGGISPSKATRQRQRLLLTLADPVRSPCNGCRALTSPRHFPPSLVLRRRTCVLTVKWVVLP